MMPVRTGLEVWGGVECTVNRVGDRYHDQLRRNGHLERPEDLDRFAALGLKTLRVPILWELAEQEDGSYDFARFDPMLERARELGIRVIAGLVHHGSGPRHTSLLEPSFEHGVAHFAAAVSERYPWIEDYTPINEPLTTARFSALYGHWYPHAASSPSFVRALLHETRATIRAMAAIRERVPGARLIQTEDIGSVVCTPMLAYQAEHENLRRWLSLDLLTGRVERSHPLHAFLVEAAGASVEELRWIVDHACPPDLIGINYYFTSDRYLTEKVEDFPAWSHGGNGRHTYADVHCTMVDTLDLRGHREVVQQVWERYRLPIALTEVHAGNTREEQLRWLAEAWAAAHDARDSGIDVRAVTVWSLLGSFDWNKLVTVEHGFYEPGVFDIRAPTPRPTALATMIRGLAEHGRYDHPVLDGQGWWRRRLHKPAQRAQGRPSRPLLLLGKGTLGRAFAEACGARGLAFQWLDHKRLDITHPERVSEVLHELRPWAVINTAGYVRVDDAERDRERCLQTNVEGPWLLAMACRGLGARLLTFSSDLVFDGAQRTPYLEHDPTAPLNVYGISKVEAERRVGESLEHSLIVRTSAFFGPEDAHNFVTQTLHQLVCGQTVRAASDVTVSPTYVPHLTDASLDLLIDGATGIWHLASRGAVSWLELARQAARAAGLPLERVLPCRFAELGLPAARPSYSVLGSARGQLMPTLEEGLEHYLSVRGAALAEAAATARVA